MRNHRVAVGRIVASCILALSLFGWHSGARSQKNDGIDLVRFDTTGDVGAPDPFASVGPRGRMIGAPAAATMPTISSDTDIASQASQRYGVIVHSVYATRFGGLSLETPGKPHSAKEGSPRSPTRQVESTLHSERKRPSASNAISNAFSRFSRTSTSWSFKYHPGTKADCNAFAFQQTQQTQTLRRQITYGLPPAGVGSAA